MSTPAIGQIPTTFTERYLRRIQDELLLDPMNRELRERYNRLLAGTVHEEGRQELHRAIANAVTSPGPRFVPSPQARNHFPRSVRARLSDAMIGFAQWLIRKAIRVRV